MSETEITNCEEALRLLAAHLAGELDASTDRQLEQHLDTCRSCYSRAEFERRLKEKLAAAGEAPVQPELARRIRKLISDFEVAAAD